MSEIVKTQFIRIFIPASWHVFVLIGHSEGTLEALQVDHEAHWNIQSVVILSVQYDHQMKILTIWDIGTPVIRASQGNWSRQTIYRMMGNHVTHRRTHGKGGKVRPQRRRQAH